MNFKKIYKGITVFSIAMVSCGVVFASSTNITTLPLGDKKVSSNPKVGYVYACSTQGGGGGAQNTGSWIHGSTWNLKEKISVQGAVSWSNAQFTIASATSVGRVITGNGLPVNSVTGIYPIASTDPAYKIDRNPNSITTHSVSFVLPSNPTLAQSPSCVPMGQIGVTLNGVAIFNALDAENRDAVANEVQDGCGGHPERQGMYHYHGLSTCAPHASESNALVGYALDGFGIYSNHDAQGNEISTSDLDECHGTTSEIMWDGKKVSMYHYVLTQDFPYNIGCYKGTSVKVMQSQEKSAVKSIQLQNGKMTQTTSTLSISSTENLSVGSKGDDVIKLQTTLEQEGYLVVPEGVAKGYFGGATRDALKKYQKAKNIIPTGIFGPKTRAVHNAKQNLEDGTIVPKKGTVIKGSTLPDYSPKVQGESEKVPGKIGEQRQMNIDNGNQGSPSINTMQPPTPPQEAIMSCDDKQEDESCSFVASGNKTISGTCKIIQENIACVPAR